MIDREENQTLKKEKQENQTLKDRLDAVLALYLEERELCGLADRPRLLRENPELADELVEFFASEDQFERLAGVPRSGSGRSGSEPLSTNTERSVFRRLGDYELIEEIARGGMGAVYKARQISLNRIVAVKVILSGRLASEEELRRFKNEAEASARLEHPGIIPIYEIDESHGLYYFSMRWIDGPSLAASVTRFRANPRAAAELLMKAARAVQHAHERGVLHRDLKPANIVLDSEGEPHVGDFGLAKCLLPDGASVGQASSAMVGSPSYMAPEQASQRPSAHTTAADVHGLGAILYEMLTGAAPFRSDTVLETLLLVRNHVPAAANKVNPLVDKDLATIGSKCLAKDPRDRYASAELLAQDLERWLGGKPILARPIGAIERARKWIKREPRTAALALSGGLLVFVTLLAIGASRERFQLNRSLDSMSIKSKTDQKSIDLLRESSRKLEKQRFQADLDRIAAADRARLANDVALADKILDECLPESRGWDWAYLKRLCHQNVGGARTPRFESPLSRLLPRRRGHGGRFGRRQGSHLRKARNEACSYSG